MQLAKLTITAPRANTEFAMKVARSSLDGTPCTKCIAFFDIAFGADQDQVVAIETG
jgi:hypothetical protein